MKINIKMLGRVVSVFLCAIVVTISLCEPAYAAAPAAYDPEDYIYNVIVNGDFKTVFFDFSGIPSLVDVWENPSGKKTQFKNVTNSMSYGAELSDTTSLRFRTFLLGVEVWDDRPAASGSVIDISDIMPGASLDMNMAFGLGITRISMVGNVNDGLNSLHVRYNFGFYMYDEDANYLGVKWGSSQTIDYPFGQTGVTSYNPSYGYVFPPDVAYVCPFLDVECTDDISLDAWRFQLQPKGFSLSVDVNMVYDNSATMDRIEEQLKDIENGIEDTNEKLDDTNDKLDDIISGGDAADAVKPDNDKISDSTDKLDDAMDDMDDAMASIPTAPTDLGGLIDDDVLDKALSNGAVLFNWDASGLSNMFPPLGLSCGLSVLFYTIFGKKG